MTRPYGSEPIYCGTFDALNLTEVMYYLYLPVRMGVGNIKDGWDVRLPKNLHYTRPLLQAAEEFVRVSGRKPYEYLYISARKGWATADNPLNRPGWHADGFGTDDLNFVWWRGAGTRFAVQSFDGISTDHLASLRQFAEQIKPECICTYPETGLYLIDPSVIHATPEITVPGWRQYIKVSLSDHRYNLENNSHNHLFEYGWSLHERQAARNDPHKAQQDYA